MEQFKKIPYKNPMTNENIIIGSPEYKKLVKKYGEPNKIKSPKTGKLINIGKGEYIKLKNEGYTDEQLIMNLKIIEPKVDLKNFDYFDQLPEELQSDILSRDIKILRQSPYISKLTDKATKNIKCQLEITITEFENYIKDVAPEYVYLFPALSGLRPTTKFNVNKCTLIQYPTLNNNYERKYNMLIEWIILKNGVATTSQKLIDNTSPLINLILKSEYDVITSYFIYNRRESCDKPHYAKNQVVKLLKLKRDTIDVNDYINLLSWYLYLHTNLLRFPVLLNKHNYFDYKVFLDDKGNIIMIESVNEITSSELIMQLQNDTTMLYQQLLSQLQKLE